MHTLYLNNTQNSNADNKKIALSLAKELQYKKLSNNSINIRVNGSEYDTFIDEGLPCPSYLKKLDTGYYIGWWIDGYTHTKRGLEFKNDTLTKICLVLNGTIEATPPENIKNEFYRDGKYTLTELNENLTDLRSSNRGLNLLHSGDDVAFNIIRAEAYKMKREKRLNYDLLLDFSLIAVPELNISKKSFSDIKSKVKNVFNWTERFYNAGTKKRVSIMSRKEAAHNAMTIKMDNTRFKVFNYLDTLSNLGTNLSKLSISFISKVLSISWVTARKYLVLYGVIKNKEYLLKEHIPLMKQLELIDINKIKIFIKKVLWLTPKEYFELLEYKRIDFRGVPF